MTVSDILLCEKGYEDHLDNEEVNWRKQTRIMIAINSKSNSEIDMDKIWPTRHHVKSRQAEAISKERMLAMLEAYNKSKQVN